MSSINDQQSEIERLRHENEQLKRLLGLKNTAVGTVYKL